MGGQDDFSRLGDLLEEVPEMPVGALPRRTSLGASRGGAFPASEQDPTRVLALVWPDVVGEEIAANARPVHLRQGRLIVSASSSAWAQTLQLMSDAIVTGLAERLGPAMVERIVFHHAGWEEHPSRHSESETAGRPRAAEPTAPGGEAPLTRGEKEALSAVERMDLTPELREKITRAMKAAFVHEHVREQQDSVR